MPQSRPLTFEEVFGQTEKGPVVASMNPSVIKRAPIDTSKPLSFEEVFGAEAQEEQIDPLRNIYNSAVKTLTSDPVANYQALFGQFEASRRTRELADLKYPTSGGATSMLGSVAGGTPQSIPAMFSPLAIPALLNFGLQAAGQARMQMWEKEQETGEEIGLLRKGAVIIGYGAATMAMERLGFKKLRGVVDGLGAKALGEIGEATLTGSTKEVAKAIGRNVGSAAVSMGLWEGGEEAMEQAAQNVLDKLYMDRSLLEGVPQAFAAGTLGGLMLAPVGVAKAHFMVKEQVGRQAEAILAAARAKEEAGLEGTTYEEPGPLFQTTQGQPSKTIQEYKAAERRQVYKFAEEMYGTPFKDLNEGQQNNALAAWEAKQAAAAEAPPAPVVGPKGFSLGPQREEGDLQKLETDDPRRIYKLPNEEPAPPELYYQQSDGSLSVIPMTGETKERIRARAMASGLIAGIEFEADKENGKEYFDMPNGQRAYGYFNPRTRTIHLAKNVLRNTAGHEMFEAAWDLLADRGDPVVEQALAQWGGKERLADVAGNYYAGWNENPTQMQKFARWLRSFWARFRSFLGKDISEENFGAYVNRRMEQLGRDVSGIHQAMAGMAQYQPTDEPIPLPAYFGNKTKLNATGIFDGLKGKFDRIVEPFGGSGYFGNIINQNAKRTLNDLDDDVIAFHALTQDTAGAKAVYDEVRKTAEKLKAIKEKYPNGGTRARILAQNILNPVLADGSTPLARAVRTFFKSSGYTSVKGQFNLVTNEGRWNRNPSTLIDHVELILKNPDLLKNTTITQEKAEDMLANAGTEELILLDPPYPAAEGKSSVGKYREGSYLQTKAGAIQFIKEDVAKAVAAGKKVVYTNQANSYLKSALEEAGLIVQEVTRRGSRGGVREVVAYSPNLSEFFQEDRRYQVDGLYHGGAARFKKFSNEAVGTGQGAAVFGWGHYLTSLREVAESYATEASSKWGVKALIGSKEVPEDSSITEFFNDFVGTREIAEGKPLRAYLNRAESIIRDTTETLQKMIDSGRFDTLAIESFRENIQEVKDFIEEASRLSEGNLDSPVTVSRTRPRVLYSVTAHKGKTPDQYDLADWYKPLSESQLAKINQYRNELAKDTRNNEKTDAIDKALEEYYKYDASASEEIGQFQDFYDALALALFSKKDASLLLLDAGIDGVRYPTGSLRAGPEGTGGYNYVIYDPEAISIEDVVEFQSAEAARAHEYFRQQREALKKEQSFFKDFWKNRKRELVDQSGNIRVALEKLGPIGHRAMVYHDLVQGTTAAAANKMADYEPLIWGGLSQSEERTLNEIAQARRYITLYDKYPDRYETSKEEADALRAYLAELPQATKDKLYPRVERLFGAFRQVLDEGLAEQLITQEDHDRMAAIGPYLPRKHLDSIDPVTYSIRGEKMSVRDSGFYYTKELDDSFVQNDTRLLLNETISRLSARAVKNRANRELLKIATENPENLLVKPAKLNEKTGRVEGITPKGYVPVGMFVDGKDVLVYMQEDMAKEWIVRDPQMKAQLARTIGWVTGVTPLKAMATGMNPAFALANFPRDLAHVFLTTNEYSQMMPTALGQMASDLAATAADAWSKKGSYKEFLAEGGGMSFLTHQGQHNLKTNAGFLERQLHDMQNLMGFLGEFTEVWTRLALRRRAIRNGKDSIEATWIARNYLDFSQGGSYSKVADQFIPYLNAGIQGTRGLLRAAKNDPGKFAWKATQLGLLSASLAYANALINPEIWDEIPDEEKARYFIIPRPELSFTDNEGNKRHMYMRIAKDQGQQSIAALFESMAMMAQGRPFNRDQVVEAVKAILPVVPDGTIIPPFADALLGYVFNKDFFRNEDIWKGEPLSKKSLEVARGTNPAYVKLTELPVVGEDISPERLRYAVNQVFVSGNPFSWLVGGAFKQMLKETGIQPRELTQQEITTQIPGVNRILKTTTPGLRYKKEIQAMKEEENTRMLEMRRGLDEAVERDIIEDSVESKRALRAYIKEQGRENRARLEERELWTRRLFNQPNRAWWMSVSTLPPELRAAAFYARWKQESPEVQQELEEQVRRIPGVMSPRFRRELRQLRASGQ